MASYGISYQKKCFKDIFGVLRSQLIDYILPVRLVALDPSFPGSPRRARTGGDRTRPRHAQAGGRAGGADGPSPGSPAPGKAQKKGQGSSLRMKIYMYSYWSSVPRKAEKGSGVNFDAEHGCIYLLGLPAP